MDYLMEQIENLTEATVGIDTFSKEYSKQLPKIKSDMSKVDCQDCLTLVVDEDDLNYFDKDTKTVNVTLYEIDLTQVPDFESDKDMVNIVVKQIDEIAEKYTKKLKYAMLTTNWNENGRSGTLSYQVDPAYTVN